MRINLTVDEITRLVGGKLIALDKSFFIEKISSIENAGKNDLAFFINRGDNSVFDNLSLEIVKKSKAGLILASSPFVDGKSYLILNDPIVAFQKITDYVLNKKNITGIHPSAVVSSYAKIDKNSTISHGCTIEDDSFIGEQTFIGSNSYIGKGVLIGNNVKIYPGVMVLDDCIIGDNSIIHSGVVIGSDGFGYEVSNAGLKKIPQIGIVRIGRNVEIGANSCIDRASFDETYIDDGVKLDNMVHVAHNVKIGKFTAILAQTIIGGSAEIGIACQIGGHVAIKDHIKIGDHVKVVSKSAVMKDVDNDQIVAGLPAIQFDKWKRMVVASMRAPEFLDLYKKVKVFFDKQNRKRSFWSKFFGSNL